MTDHMFVLDPPNPYNVPRFWSPWKCICGTAGGTGADVEGAEMQYRMHVAGLWPAYIEPHPKATHAVVFEGRTIWVGEVPLL